MSDLPLVSCIMPTHNRRLLAAKALEYFLRQDYSNRELIIVDDGSDPIHDLAQADSRLRYLRLKNKMTVGAKRNLACQEAKGEIIIHWDDDDWMASNRISTQVENLLKAPVDICGLDKLLYYEPESGKAWQYVYPQDGKPWVAGGTLCYAKAVWKRHPFPDLNVGEDTRFVWSDSARKISVLPNNTFYVALLHARNTSSKVTHDRRWHSHSPSEIRQQMGKDWNFYADFLKGKRMAEPIDIVMLTYNRLKYLQQTVEALYERTKYPFRLTIVDNASAVEVRQYLEQNRDKFHQLILNEANEYVPAFHRGIEKTTSEIFIATEPDIVVPALSPCWLTQYMEILQENPRLGLLGIRLDPKDRTPLTPAWSGGTDSAPVYNKRVLLGNVGVWMMAIRRKAYPNSFYSECSVCEAVRKKGYAAGYTRDIYARHLGWYEYRDYPEYLLEKSKRPHPCFPHYAEAQLVDEQKLLQKKTPAIIITTFNERLSWLQDLLASLKAFTPQPLEIIVVDNGTTDGTHEYLRRLDWVTTIRNETNLDDTKGVNQALALVKTEYIVKIDTDALIADYGWWEAAYQYMEEHPQVGIAGDVWNPRFEIVSRLYKEGWSPKQHGIERLAHAQGGFMVLRKKMLEQIGFFNEDYPHDGMDVEISYRALSYGWELGHLKFVKAQIIHEAKFSSEFKVFHPVRNSPLRQKIMQKVHEFDFLHAGFKEEIPLWQNGACAESLKPRAQCQVSTNAIWLAGAGWDNCLISRRSFQNLVFSVDISDWRGSVILKIRLQNQHDPADNSYHVILGDWGNYVAKAGHVFKRLVKPAANPIQFHMVARDNIIQIYLGGDLAAQFQDDDLKEGHVAFGVKDGQARFLNPKVQVF